MCWCNNYNQIGTSSKVMRRNPVSTLWWILGLGTNIGLLMAKWQQV